MKDLMKKTILMIGILLVVLVFTGAGCNLYKTSKTDSNSSSTVTAPSAVTISNLQFSPQTLTIKKGSAVTWTNNESTNHTITADDGSFESGNLSKGKTFQKTFDTLGTFSYHCSIHPSMKGKIVVGN